MLTNFVHMFNQVFGVPMLNKPGAVEIETLRTRMAMHAEEFLETLEAAGANSDELAMAAIALSGAIGSIDLSRFDLPAFVDGHADMDYISAGTMLVHGVDMRQVHLAVHKANLAKRQPDGTIKRRADGKVMKPDGWRAPDVAGELKRQGWTP